MPHSTTKIHLQTGAKIKPKEHKLKIRSNRLGNLLGQLLPDTEMQEQRLVVYHRRSRTDNFFFVQLLLNTDPKNRNCTTKTIDTETKTPTYSHTHTHTTQHSIHVHCVAQSHFPHTNSNQKTTQTKKATKSKAPRVVCSS